jgi:hypothetical protein
MVGRFWLTYVLVFAVVHIAFAPQRTQAQGASLSTTDVRSLVEAATSQVSSRRRLLIDPRIVDQMTASANLYAQNLCEAQGEDCGKTLRDTNALGQHVDAYLAEVSNLGVRTARSLGDRLSRGRLAMAGWPANVPIDYGWVDVPYELQKHDYFVRLGSDLVALGNGGQAILALPGAFEVTAQKGGDSRAIRLKVESRRSIALTTTEQAKAATGPAALRPSPNVFCSVSAPPYRGPFSLFNSGRATISESIESRRANEAPHVHQFGLSIDIRNESSIKCDIVCRQAISTLFAEAVAAWRSGCSRCDTNAMSVLSAYGTTWIDWRIGRRLREIAGGSVVPLDLAKPQPGEAETVTASPMGGTSAGIHHYMNASADPAIKEALCRLPSGAAPWVPAARSQLCGAGMATPEILRPVIVLKNAETECGNSAVACALPYQKVEINFREYRYAVSTGTAAGEFVIGTRNSGEVLELRKIILHEVGHWFGVPHAGIAKEEQFLDIMASQYGAGEDCISPHSLRLLTNAADMRWEYRIRSGGALMPPGVRTR